MKFLLRNTLPFINIAAENPLSSLSDFSSLAHVVDSLSISVFLKSNSCPLYLFSLHAAQTFEISLEPSTFGQFVSMVLLLK